MVQLGEVNAAGTKNALNVPEFTPGQEWVVANRPNMARPGGTSFGMPQVNIKQEIGQFGDRMRAMGMGMENFGNPRSLPEFEAAISGQFLARSQQAGKTLSTGLTRQLAKTSWFRTLASMMCFMGCVTQQMRSKRWQMPCFS